MQFRFNGDQQMLLTQYFDEATDRPLLVDPGGVYEMRPAGTWVVPVPPQDGRWEAVEDDEPAAEPPELPDPPPATVVSPPAQCPYCHRPIQHQPGTARQNPPDRPRGA